MCFFFLLGRFATKYHISFLMLTDRIRISILFWKYLKKYSRVFSTCNLKAKPNFFCLLTVRRCFALFTIFTIITKTFIIFFHFAFTNYELNITYRGALFEKGNIVKKMQIKFSWKMIVFTRVISLFFWFLFLVILKFWLICVMPMRMK